MLRDRRFPSVEMVSEIYEAALDADRWSSLLPRLVATIGGQGGVIGVSVPERTSLALSCVHEIDPDALALWEREFDCFDPFFDRVGSLPAGTLCHAAASVPTEELRGVPVFHEVFERAGYRDLLSAVLVNHGHSDGFATVFRMHQAPTFERSEVDRARVLVPHLVHAAQIHVQLSEHLGGGALEVLGEYLPFGVIAVGARFRVVYANRRAIDLVDRVPGLALRSGRVATDSSADGRRLGVALSRAEATGRGNSAGGASVVQVARPPPARPLQVLIAPVPRRSSERVFGLARDSVSALLVLGDPDSNPAPTQEVLARLFGLPPSLARLAAALVRGESVAEHAEQVGVTEGTARFQLKDVMRRLGARRQSDLVRLLISGIAQLRLDRELGS